MYTAMWTFKAPAGMTRADIDAIIAATAHTYLCIPGLIRKYYALAEDGASLSGIYLWESKAQETPMVVESRENRLVAG